MASNRMLKPVHQTYRLLIWTGGVLVVLSALFVWYFQSEPPIDRNRVWKVGSDNTLPYHALEIDDGGQLKPTGIAGELIAEAARRVGIRLEWSVQRVGALAAGDVDLWPANSVAASRDTVRVTRPFLRHSLVLLSLESSAEHRTGNGVFPRIVMRASRLSEPLRDFFPGSELMVRPEREAALLAVCAGEADALLMESRPLQALLLNRPPGCLGHKLSVSGTAIPPQELGFGSTPQAEPVAKLLRREVDAMIAEGELGMRLKDWTYFSSGEMELIYREAAANEANQLSLVLIVLLLVLSMALSWLFLQARRAQQAAIAANQAKTQFLANISHEIRTPLNGILGLSEVLSRSSLDDKQRDLLGNLKTSGGNLLAIVNDVLDLAQVARGQFNLKPRPIDVAALLADAAVPFLLAARDKHLEFGITGLDGLPRGIHADPVRLRQIFMNLVGNAIKFTDSGAVRVRVSASDCVVGTEVGCQLEIVVSDTGIGMTPEARDCLFEKFFQADSSISRRFGGTGLGLSIVKEIVDAMDGLITVQSAPGVGSTFRVWLRAPLVGLPADPPQVVADNQGLAVGTRVLVAEDNRINTVVVGSLLEKAGCTVHYATDGQQAVTCWSEGDFDLVLMDCQMPNMDGYQATAEIRRREAGVRRTPIIAVTASAMSGDRDRCLDAGMDDFLSKPIDPEDLDRVIRFWAERSPRRTISSS
jgi:signal transduction histidine kinase/CheY-like chemotaxis protein